MHTLRFGLAVVAVIATAAAVPAQPQPDPDWPCIQRKVEHLSLGVMWPHPLPEEAEPLDDELRDLAARLALRRVSEEEARELIEAAAEAHPELDVEDWGRVYDAAFQRIDRDRARIVEGIARYARGQEELGARIDELRAEMDRLEAIEDPGEEDFDRMDEVEEQLDWTIRTFEERDRALTYVCESPVLLEQRAYSLAQMILQTAG